jgi:hypothetical protein
MSREKTCKRTKRGRQKKQPYKSLFQRHGTESNLEKAEDAYAAYCTGDHIVSSVCGKYKMPLHLGLEIAGQIMPREEVGNITIPAKILAKHGGAITVLINLMLKHRKDLSTPTLQRKVERASLDILRYLEDNGAVNLKCAAEQTTKIELSGRDSPVNDAMCALLHHYSGKRVSPGNIRKTLRRAQKQLLAEGTPPN